MTAWQNFIGQIWNLFALHACCKLIAFYYHHYHPACIPAFENLPIVAVMSGHTVMYWSSCGT